MSRRHAVGTILNPVWTAHAVLRWAERGAGDRRRAYDRAVFVGRMGSVYGYRDQDVVFCVQYRNGRWQVASVWRVAWWERRWARRQRQRKEGWG